MEDHAKLLEISVVSGMRGVGLGKKKLKVEAVCCFWKRKQ
jgi:hypothetical protein